MLWHQAVAIASASALFSPKVILVGGGVVLMAGYPFETLKRRIAECLPDAGRVQELDIRRAGLGWQAAIHGAVSLFDPAKRPDCRE